MEAIKEYLTPAVELIELTEVLTASHVIPEIEEDDNELPKLDW